LIFGFQFEAGPAQKAGISVMYRAHKKLSGAREPFFLTGLPVRDFFI
jgi:hypothetical protein